MVYLWDSAEGQGDGRGCGVGEERLVKASKEPGMRRLYLLYHELSRERREYSYVVDEATFAGHLDLFLALRADAQELLPEVTFDDGHESNYEVALPLLQARGMRAEFFITAGWIGNRSGYMSWNELRALHAAGQGIGAHGYNHALMTHCNDAELRTELEGARTLLEDRLGAAVTSLSFPGGRFNRRVLEACGEAGYTRLYSSVPAASDGNEATIGRLNVRAQMDAAWMERLFAPGSRVLHQLGRQDRLKSAAKSVLGDRLYAALWVMANRKGDEDGTPQDMGA
jgi:hypothetical protein